MIHKLGWCILVFRFARGIYKNSEKFLLGYVMLFIGIILINFSVVMMK